MSPCEKVILWRHAPLPASQFKSLFFVHGPCPVPVGTKPPTQSRDVWSPGPPPSRCGARESAGSHAFSPVLWLRRCTCHLCSQRPPPRAVTTLPTFRGPGKGRQSVWQDVEGTQLSVSSGSITPLKGRRMSGMGHEGFSLVCVGYSVFKGTGGQSYEGLASGREAEAGHRRAQLL